MSAILISAIVAIPAGTVAIEPPVGDVPVALVSGYLLFGEVPSAYAAVGAAIIIGAAVYVTRVVGR